VNIGVLLSQIWWPIGAREQSGIIRLLS